MPYIALLNGLLLSLVLLSLPMDTRADTVWLKNGDRLTGTIKLYDGNRLVLETEYAGTIVLKWAKVATLETEQELLVKRDDVTGEKAQSLRAGESGTVVLVNGEAPKEIPLSAISQILKPKPIIEDFSWKGNIGVSLDYKRADSDKDEYAVDLRTKARHGLWRHNGYADYNRELKNDVVTTDNWSAEYALDYFFAHRLFWQNRFDYKRDRIENLERQRSLGTGPGYQFWDTELGAFSVAGLLNRSDYRYDNGGRDQFYAMSIKWDYNRYLLGQTLELFTVGEVGKPLSGAADYDLNAEAGLRYKVTDWASLNLKAKKEKVSGADGNLDETRYSIGFGVGW